MKVLDVTACLVRFIFFGCIMAKFMEKDQEEEHGMYIKVKQWKWQAGMIVFLVVQEFLYHKYPPMSLMDISAI
jgi:mannose-1-phosphate guanylyltransferase